MATFFGEVRDIPSRAVDDDEEVDVEMPTVFFDLPDFSDMTQLPAYDTVCIYSILWILTTWIITKDVLILGWVHIPYWTDYV